MNFHSAYRPDIDGLRAVAVLLVIVFHAFPKLVPGGFIGVDVFFVISGYLISKIIYVSLSSGSFNFFEFYQRRIIRIFPALIVVLVSVAVAGLTWLSPREYAALGRHIVAGAGFVSNLLLWTEVGYFDAAPDEKPLLHLWSLGVEEQFYIFWPLLMFVGWRYFRRHFLLFLFGLALASFAANAWLGMNGSAAAFYLPWFRFWELLLGGALSCWESLRATNKAESTINMSGIRLSGFLSAVAGIVLIGAGAVLIQPAITSSFPGWWALLPTLGAILLISAGSGSPANRHILGSKPFVFVGKISYPLYLWHWPLLSFASTLEFDTSSGRSGVVDTIVRPCDADL
jgi:peptidoglycan/LPS O-acetylase OafA/YrhL